MCLIAEHCTTVRTLPIIDPNPAFVGNRPLQDDPLQVRQGSVPPPPPPPFSPGPCGCPFTAQSPFGSVDACSTFQHS